VADVDVRVDHPRHHEAIVRIDDLLRVQTSGTGGHDHDAAVTHAEGAARRRRVLAANPPVADQEVQLHGA
jgi:hypothetical protein